MLSKHGPWTITSRACPCHGGPMADGGNACRAEPKMLDAFNFETNASHQLTIARFLAHSSNTNLFRVSCIPSSHHFCTTPARLRDIQAGHRGVCGSESCCRAPL